VRKKLSKHNWIEYGNFLIEIKKVPDQSGLKNVIQHTYHLKEDKNGTSDKPQK
jgi:hypothetical protein